MANVVKQILEGADLRDILLEKLIVIGKNQNYGQVVFMAGGGASGKGFVIDKFMDGNKFKVRDVDAWKLTFMKIDELKGKYPEIRGLNLKKPEDVFKLHDFVDRMKIKDKTLNLLLADLKPDRLPNLIFDITAKDTKSIFGTAQKLVEMGYDPKNIHIVWALTHFDTAVVRNQDRDRVVPEDILFQAHTGAAKTMSSLIFQNKLDRESVDGDVFVVLNNTEETKAYARSANQVDVSPVTGKAGSKNLNVEDFTYLRVKQVGKPVDLTDRDRIKLHTWIFQNAPDPARDPKNPIPLSKD